MRKRIINQCMNCIKNNCDYDDIKLAEIKYGLEGIYMLITKMTIIILSAIALGIIKEVAIFLLLYNFIRMPSFGLHATKSWICLVSSLLIFLIIPYLCTIITIPTWLKIGMGIVLIIMIFKNAPADTHKKPIVNPKRRKVYKALSTIIATIYIITSILTTNQFIATSLIFSLIVQSIIIAPTTYKIFNLPYDNYKVYEALNMI